MLILILSSLFLFTRAQYHFQIITETTTTSCSQKQPQLYYIYYESDLEFSQNLQYAPGLLVYGWIKPQFRLTQNAITTIASLLNGVDTLGALSLKSSSTLLISSDKKSDTQIVTDLDHVWLWFIFSIEFSTGSLQGSLFNTKSQQSSLVQLFDKNQVQFVANNLVVGIGYSKFATQPSCIIFDDLAVTIDPLTSTFDEYMLQYSKTGTVPILKFSFTPFSLLASARPNNERTLKAQFYNGDSKESYYTWFRTKTNYDYLTFQSYDYISMGTGFIEDYGQIGPMLMDKDFSIYFWMKVSSNLISFKLLSFIQPLIQNIIPMFEISFDGTGIGHQMNVLWAQETQTFDQQQMSFLNWQHVGVVIYLKKGVSQADGLYNGQLIETKSYMYLSDLQAYMTIQFGSTKNTFPDYYGKENFQIKSFELYKGSFYTSTPSCLLYTGRGIPNICVLCASGYFMLENKCVTQETCPNGRTNSIYQNCSTGCSRGQFFQVQQSLVESNGDSLTYQSKLLDGAGTYKFSKPMQCIPNIILSSTMMNYSCTSDRMILQPLVISSIHDSNFVTQTEPGVQIYRYIGTYNASCDPNIKSGYATFNVINAQDQYNIPLLVTLNLPVSITIVSFSSKLLSIKITSPLYDVKSQSINFTAQVGSASSVFQNFTVQYVLGLQTTGVNAQATTSDQDGISKYSLTTGNSQTIGGITNVALNNNYNPQQYIMQFFTQVVTQIRQPYQFSYYIQQDSNQNTPFKSINFNFLSNSLQSVTQCSDVYQTRKTPYQSYKYIISGGTQQISTVTYPQVTQNKPLMLYSISRLVLNKPGSFSIKINVQSSTTFDVQFIGSTVDTLEIKYAPLAYDTGESGYTQISSSSNLSVVTLTGQYSDPTIIVSLVGWDISGANSDGYDSIEILYDFVFPNKLSFTYSSPYQCTINNAVIYYVIFPSKKGFIVNQQDYYLDKAAQNAFMTGSPIFQPAAFKIQTTYTSKTNNFYWYGLGGISYKENQILDMALMDSSFQQQQIQIGLSLTAGVLSAAQIFFVDFLMQNQLTTCDLMGPDGQCQSCLRNGRTPPDCSCPNGYYDTVNGCLKCPFLRAAQCTSTEIISCQTGSSLPNCACDSGYDIDPNSQQCVPQLTLPAPILRTASQNNTSLQFNGDPSQTITLTAWIGPTNQSITTPITLTLDITRSIQVKYQSSNILLQTQDAQLTYFDGTTNFQSSWTWVLIVYTSDKYLKGLFQSSTINNYVLQQQQTQTAYSAGTQFLTILTDPQISELFIHQGFDALQAMQNPLALSFMALNSQQIVSYSISGLYRGSQRVIDQAQYKYNTTIGQSAKSDYNDPVIEVPRGFLFSDSFSFIPTRIPLSSTMTFSFWTMVNTYYVQSVDDYPSSLFIFRTLTNTSLLVDPTKQMVTNAFSIQFLVSNISVQNYTNIGFFIQVCVMKYCMNTNQQIPILKWQFISVSYQSNTAQQTLVSIQSPTSYIQQVLPTDPYTGLLPDDKQFIGLLGSNFSTPNSQSFGYYINQFSVWQGAQVLNPWNGGYGQDGGSLMAIGQPQQQSAMVCNNRTTLTRNNTCVEPSRTNCSGNIDDQSYYYVVATRVCTQCYSLNKSSQCRCSPGQYQTASGGCAACAKNCLTCTSASKCETCAPGRVDKPQCVCPDGTFQAVGQVNCTSCDLKICATCTLNNTNCITCAVGRAGAPKCSCADGYYSDVNGSCLKCSSACQTCDRIAYSCTSCVANRTSTPSCDCAIGYIDVNGQCLACSSKCGICQGNVDNCLSCNQQANRQNPLPDCPCINRYYEDYNQICQPCAIQCATCSLYNICTTCFSKFRNPAPVCACQDGYYQADNGYCSVCNTTYCSTCETNDKKCITCADLRENPPDCKCASNTFEQFSNITMTVTCLLCSQTFRHCTTCDPTQCLSCEAGYVAAGGGCSEVSNNEQPPANNKTHCSISFRENSEDCISCGYNVMVGDTVQNFILYARRCNITCPVSTYYDPAIDSVVCSNSDISDYYSTKDAILSVNLPVDGFSWLNPYTVIMIFLKFISPLIPGVVSVINQFHLLTLPIFMHVYIPAKTFLTLQALYYINPYPQFFYISIFMFNKYQKQQNREYEYYSNEINSYVIWAMCGQHLTILFILVSTKYLIYVFTKLNEMRNDKSPVNYNRKRRADEHVQLGQEEDDNEDDNLSVDSVEEIQVEEQLNQDDNQESTLRPGEIELQEFQNAYQDIQYPDNLQGYEEKLLEKKENEQEHQTVTQPRRVSTQIVSSAVFKPWNESFSYQFVNFLLRFKLPKIVREREYTIIFACAMELSIIPIAFGALSTIVLQQNDYIYIIPGVLFFSIVCLYVFLLIYICGFRHYTQSWKYLRMFYTSLTYIEWYEEINNKVYRYSSYVVKIVLITPALALARNVIITTFFVLMRTVPQLALVSSLTVQSIYVLLILLFRPFQFRWYNFLSVFCELLLVLYYLFLFVAHQQIHYYINETGPDVASRIYNSFDLLQVSNQGTSSIDGMGTFIWIIETLYIVTNTILISLKAFLMIVRATDHPNSFFCKKVQQQNSSFLKPKQDLEFSYKSKSMLLRERLPKGSSVEPLPQFWKKMNTKLQIQEVHQCNADNFTKLDTRQKNRIRKIPQYERWMRDHDIELEAADIEDLDKLSEIPEEQQEFQSQRYSVHQEYTTLKQKQEFGEVHSHFTDVLSLSHFMLIIELLDENMDNHEILIGRPELQRFIQQDLLKDQEQLDLLEDPEQERMSAELIKESLQNLNQMKESNPQLADIGHKILNYLRGSIIVSNEKELDELLLCGLFALKYNCKRFNQYYAKQDAQAYRQLFQKMTNVSTSISRNITLQIKQQE